MIELTTGSFDRPDRVVPDYGHGNRVPSRLGGQASPICRQTSHAAKLPVAKSWPIVSHQHPDHDWVATSAHHMCYNG